MRLHHTKTESRTMSILNTLECICRNIYWGFLLLGGAPNNITCQLILVQIQSWHHTGWHANMADHGGYKMHTYVSYSLYLKKYLLTANVSAYVEYVNTFVCQNYACKIVVLHISIHGRQKRICRAKLSYVNSSDMQMYWYILHMISTAVCHENVMY